VLNNDVGKLLLKQECLYLLSMFGVKPVTDQVLDRKRKFLTKLVDCVCDNAVCVAVSGFARAELDSMN